ncbi:MAG: hypothetical protein K8R48_05480 [Alphaproteobacteria bacterium]|nr:hypothetical protein [Alphaproteobacteria bacterium]
MPAAGAAQKLDDLEQQHDAEQQQHQHRQVGQELAADVAEKRGRGGDHAAPFSKRRLA